MKFLVPLLFAAMTLFTVSGAELLRQPIWRTLNGSTRKTSGGVEFVHPGGTKACFFYNPGRELPVTPGKTYRIAVRFAGECPLKLMLSMPGSKRTPYPMVEKSGNLLELDFTARPDERKVRIHLQLTTQHASTVIKSITFREITPSDNLLASRQYLWRLAKAHGAGGSLQQDGDTVTVTKTNHDGYIAFLANPSDFPTVPGRHYLISATFTPLSGKVQGSIMVQMPGAARRPFPTVHAKHNDLNAPETLQFTYTAKSDEKLVRPHFILKGKGAVKLTSFTVKEISADEMRQLEAASQVSARHFDGRQLRSNWELHGVAGNQSDTVPHIEFTTAPTGGIVCRNLNWQAQEIKALELKCRFTEGGYLRCDFSSTDGKRTFSGYLGHSVIPDGKWHTIMFPVAEAPAWRHRITQVKFSFFGKNSTVGFAGLDATSYCNRINNVVPRGEYTLSRLAGKAAAKLQLLDSDYRIIQTIDLPADKNSVDFTAPEMTMAVRPVPAAAPLLVTLNKLPKLDLPAAFWRGKWIWCQNGFGPDAANVWFEKKFTLNSTPQEAAIVLTGDDAFELFVNGKSVGTGNNWQQPGKFDLTGLLHAGENRITVKVYNAQAWGALIGELYCKIDGKPHYIFTDGSWKYHIGGDTMPPQFPSPAFVLGAPPLAPWGTRAYYRYVGPVSKITIQSHSAPGEFDLTTDSVPEIDTDKLTVTLQTPDGKSRDLTALVTPSTGKWRPGEIINVKYRLSNDRHAGKLFIKEEFLHVTGNAPINSLSEQSVASPPLATVKVIDSGTRPQISINGKSYAPFIHYLAAGYSDFPASRWYQIRNGKLGGHKIMRISSSFEQFWLDKNTFDFTRIDALFDVLQMYAPDTKVILQIRCHMPLWWLAENPGNEVVYFGNAPRHRQKDRQSLASQKWLTDASKILRQILRHLKNSPYADRIIGIAISEGWNSEWFQSYQDDNNRVAMSGYAPADYERFRAYLRKKYVTDAALQQAWRQPQVTIDTAPMPTWQQIYSSQAGCMLDPAGEMQLIDWYINRNETIGNALETFCQVVKEESSGKWLAGAYYGYFLAFSNIFNRLQTVGHLAIEKIARTPHVDFVTAPSFYTWRFPGQGDAIMQLAESFTAHGKLVIIEQDSRFFSETSAYEIRNGMASTPETSVGIVERAFALAFTRGVGTHWYDLYDNSFREKIILEHIRRGITAYESLPPVAGTTPAEICIVADTRSAMYCKHNAGDGLAAASVGEMRRRFNEVAAPFRTVLLQDLLDKDVIPAHKFYIITNLIMLDDTARKALLDRFAKEKATVLWLYGAGLSTPTAGPDVKNMENLLGITFQRSDRPDQPILNWELNGKHGTAKNFNRTFPWFYPASGFDRLLGSTPDGKAALVTFKRNGVTHIFSTLMNLPPDLIRELARNAGVHLYGDGSDPVFIGNDIVAIHGKTGGRKNLLLPPGLELIPLLGPEKSVKKSGEAFEVIPGRTYIFHVRKTVPGR